MNDSHDPNKTLKESPIQLTGDAPKILVDDKLKKILLYLAGAIVVTVIALLVPAISLVLALSMPVAFGLLVYAGYLRYKAVVKEDNKAPDWSKIQVPPVEQPKDAKDPKDQPPTDRVTYS